MRVHAGVEQASIARWHAAGPMRLGLAASLMLVFGLGTWAAFASISGAVVASGRVKVVGERQVVQHPDGGVVAVLNVREGDRVEAGDMLFALDDRRLRAELAIVQSRLLETLARIGRLEAEQDSAEDLQFTDELLAAAEQNREIEALIGGQRRLLEARRTRAARETEQLLERQAQIREEISGFAAQRTSMERQMALIEQELEDQRSLLDKGLTLVSRVLALERELARLEGERGSLVAGIAEAQGRITEIDIQLTARDAASVEEAVTELRDLNAEAAELRERRLGLAETIDRLELRAPRDGVVIGLTVFTLGAVVRPGEPILHIVPTDEELVVEARIEATDIDQVYPGQSARLRFAAFNQRTTPEVPSTVLLVSPDAFEDERSGRRYYIVELALHSDALETLGGLRVVAGMPVDAFIQTGARSPMSYLAQPMTDFLARALKER
jgi:HlyD family secretion protein